MRLSVSMAAVRYSVAGADRPRSGHRPLRELDPTEVRNRPVCAAAVVLLNTRKPPV